VSGRPEIFPEEAGISGGFSMRNRGVERFRGAQNIVEATL
jgi:hypothetical protein